MLSLLALLDYVSRAHEIAICPSSVVRPSVRPSISQLPVSLNLMHEFLSNFNCGFPWATYIVRSDIFLFSLTWDPMGAKISKRYSYKAQLKFFKLFLNFLPNGPHKTMFGIFKILKNEILTNFIRFR